MLYYSSITQSKANVLLSTTHFNIHTRQYALDKIC